MLQRLCSLVLVAGLALALAPAGPERPDGSTAGVRPVAKATPSPTYRTFTLNVAFPNTVAETREDMLRAMTLGDAGGFQEVSDEADRQMLIALCAEQDWGYYMPPEGGLAIPMVWNRDRFRLIDGHTVKVHGPVGRSPSRYINVVRLRELATGKVFGLINTHVLSGASRDAQLSNMKLIPYVRRHFRMLRTEIKRLFAVTEHVFVSGDFNVNYLADRVRRNPGLPTDRLGDLVDFDMPLQASWGTGSLLDYGLSVKDDGGLVKQSAEIVPGFHSDHRAIAFTYATVDLFATGPVVGDPTGDPADRQRPVARLARAVGDAEPGASVRLVVDRIDAPVLTSALLAAAARGVAVRVVLGGGKPTGAEQALSEALGRDTAAPSWLVRCSKTCLGGDGDQQVNALLVRLAGGTSEVTMVASAAPTKGSFSRWTDVYRSSDADLHAAYGRLFDEMALDADGRASGGGKRVVEAGRLALQLYPVKPIARRDPVLEPLSAVGCRNARGLRTGDGRTNVRVMVSSWSGDRGQAIARRLVELDRSGCDVAVLAGPQVLSGIRRTLERGGVPMRTAKAGRNLLVIDGRYAGRGRGHVAFTGGPGWTNGALGSDGATLVVTRKPAVAAYLDAFSAAWPG